MKLIFLLDSQDEVANFTQLLNTEEGLLQVTQEDVGVIDSVMVTVSASPDLDDERSLELLLRAGATLIAMGSKFESRILDDEASKKVRAELYGELSTFECELRRLFSICLRAHIKSHSQESPQAESQTKSQTKPPSSSKNTPKKLANKANEVVLGPNELVMCLCEMGLGGYFAQLFAEVDFKRSVQSYLSRLPPIGQKQALLRYIEDLPETSGYREYFEPNDLPTLEAEYEFIRSVRNRVMHHRHICYQDVCRARKTVSRATQEMRTVSNRILCGEKPFDGGRFMHFVQCSINGALKIDVPDALILLVSRKLRVQWDASRNIILDRLGDQFGGASWRRRWVREPITVWFLRRRPSAPARSCPVPVVFGERPMEGRPGSRRGKRSLTQTRSDGSMRCVRD